LLAYTGHDHSKYYIKIYIGGSLSDSAIYNEHFLTIMSTYMPELTEMHYGVHA